MDTIQKILICDDTGKLDKKVNEWLGTEREIYFCI